MEEKGLRVFGRSEIPAHETDTGAWLDGAYLGLPEERDGIPVALSSWQQPDDAADLFLERSGIEGTGTTLLIPGFHEPDRRRPRISASGIRKISVMTSPRLLPSGSGPRSAGAGLRFRRGFSAQEAGRRHTSAALRSMDCGLLPGGGTHTRSNSSTGNRRQFGLGSRVPIPAGFGRPNDLICCMTQVKQRFASP